MNVQRKISLTLLCLLFSGSVFAQLFTTPVEYLQFINQESDAITKDLWSYVKASAHSGSAKKIDKRRTGLMETINNAQKRVANAPGYKGDLEYRNALSKYLKLNYVVLKEDFGKIVDMEAIAEQSYDLMEAYLMAKEEAHKKLDEAQEELNAQQESFAAKHNIILVETTSKKGEKLEKASMAFKYYNQIYLIFFKSYKQELYLMDALSSNNVGTIEQNNAALLAITEEGLAKLDTFRRYGMDVSLKVAAQNYIKFHEYEAKQQIPLLINFYLTKEKYDKTKASFDAKKPAERTKVDVDSYNQVVSEYNKAVNDFNSINGNLTKRRNELLDKWNKATQTFFTTHVP